MTETKEIDTNHTRGNDVQLFADVVGNMVSSIKTISVSGDGQHINQRHFQRDNILYINNAESADQGIYVCQGTDTKGSILFEYNANLLVAGITFHSHIRYSI